MKFANATKLHRKSWGKVCGLACVLSAVLGSYARHLSEVDQAGVRAVEAGSYTIFLGGGQPGQSAGVEGKFAISGRQVVLP